MKQTGNFQVRYNGIDVYQHCNLPRVPFSLLINSNEM